MAIPTWLDQLILTWGYWAVLVAVALESMGVPFPGETGLLAAAVYAGTGRPLNITLVIVAASAGAILGDNLGYAVGYFGGNPLVRRILKALHVRDSALAYTAAYFHRHGDKTVFVGRFFALLRATVAFLAGVNRMHWRTFLVWNATGGIVWAALYGLLGFFLGRHLSLLNEVVHLIGVGGTVIVIVAIAALIAFFVIRRRREEARTEREEAQPEPDAHTAPTPPPTASAPPVSAPPVSAPPVSAPPVSAPPTGAPPTSSPPTTTATPSTPARRRDASD